jgi:hypothetical protein
VHASVDWLIHYCYMLQGLVEYPCPFELASRVCVLVKGKCCMGQQETQAPKQSSQQSAAVLVLSNGHGLPLVAQPGGHHGMYMCGCGGEGWVSYLARATLLLLKLLASNCKVLNSGTRHGNLGASGMHRCSHVSLNWARGG